MFGQTHTSGSISLAFIVLTGFIAGSYPALYLSSFNAVKVLKGTFRAGRFATLPRKVLVVLQYTVSVALIIGTIIVYRQVQHAKNRPVGYTRDGLLMIHIKSPDLKEKFDVVSAELKNNGIAVATSGASIPLRLSGIIMADLNGVIKTPIKWQALPPSGSLMIMAKR